MDSENVLFEIVVGTYEKFLLGYYLELHSDVSMQFKFLFKNKYQNEIHKYLLYF